MFSFIGSSFGRQLAVFLIATAADLIINKKSSKKEPRVRAKRLPDGANGAHRPNGSNHIGFREQR